jgi:hypothetical protein
VNQTAFLAAVSAVSSSLLAGPLQFDFLGRYDHGAFDEGAAEISAYDPTSKQLYVVNGATDAIDVLDLTNPAAPTLKASISVGEGSPNSVAVKNGVLAVAVEALDKTQPGQVQLYNAAAGHAHVLPGRHEDHHRQRRRAE